MVGEVIAMQPEEYEAWLAGGRTGASTAQSGEQLFKDLACATCHLPDNTGRGPSLVNLAGATVQLVDGRTVVADDNYLRESIVNSQAKIVKGYQPIMPVFQGQIGEENLMQLISFIKSQKK
jgi:cytochrome c oxidase subunit 2